MIYARVEVRTYGKFVRVMAKGNETKNVVLKYSCAGVVFRGACGPPYLYYHKIETTGSGSAFRFLLDPLIVNADPKQWGRDDRRES
jgi:hypothetical protein